MKLLIIITSIGLLFSFFADRKKTFTGIKKGINMFLKMLPAFLSIIMLVSVVLYLIPQEVMLKYLGHDSGIFGYLFAAIIGSVAMIPGFIAYPVAGMLVKSGVGYPVLAIFITTLMMVGIVTIPLEKKYFGLKVAILRNSLSFVGALVIGSLIGLLWGIV